MSWNKYSDLPWEVGGDNVVVVQPRTTVSVSKKDFLQGGNDAFQSVFDSVMKLEGLVHTGSLQTYNYSDTPGDPISWHSCGGDLCLTSTLRDDLRWLRCWSNVAIVCNGIGCNMKLAFKKGSDILNLQNLMLHMMLKQMDSKLSMLNYVDCTQKTEPFGPVTQEKLKIIPQVGVISVYSKSLFGTMNNGFYDQFSKDFSLGFMLMPGMNTGGGCDDFDEWYKFLVRAKFAQMKSLHDSLTTSLLGIKTRTRK